MFLVLVLFIGLKGYGCMWMWFAFDPFWKFDFDLCWLFNED